MVSSRQRRLRKYFSSIKFKITFSFGIVNIVVILLTIAILSTLITSRMTDQAKTAIKNQVDQTNDILELFFASQIKKTDYLLIDKDLSSWLQYDGDNLDEIFQIRSQITSKLFGYAYDFRYSEVKGSNYYGGNAAISLYLKNKLLIPHGTPSDELLSYSEVQEAAWFQQLASGKSTFAWETGIMIDGTRYIGIYRRIIDMMEYDDIAVLRICVPVAKIQDFMIKNKIVAADAIVYFSDNNQVIWSSGDKELVSYTGQWIENGSTEADGMATVVINKKKYLLYRSTSPLNGWTLACAVPLADIYREAAFTTSIIFAVLVCAALISALISNRISSFITNRLGVLLKKTNRLAEGNFDMETAIGGEDEIAELDSCFNEMVDKIKYLDQRELKLRLLLEEVKLELMQEQINPHLLYNTLSMIRYTAKKQDQPEIVSLSANLINFYKRFLNEGQILTSISGEIEMVKSYAEVVKYVYELDLDLHFFIEEEIADLCSIKLFLQPMVENAIIHGIRPKHKGQVIICGWRKGDAVIFLVTDNGIGMDDKTLEEIRSISGCFGSTGADKFTTDSSDTETRELKHYGLYNAAKRINLLFGEEYGITLDSIQGSGTEVITTIPALTRDEALKQFGYDSDGTNRYNL